MTRGELVLAISGDEQRAGSLNPPADESHEVQGCRVSPVKILEHHQADALRARQFLEQNPEQVVTEFAVSGEGTPRLGYLGGNLVHRGEGPGCRQPVARTPECARVAPVLRHEPLHEGALSESRLSGDEQQLAATLAGFLKASGELVELRLALEQVHGWRLSDTCRGMS